MSSRRRPLLTCGVSFLAIANSASSRAQNLDGRLGLTIRKMVRIAKLVSPLIFVLLYQCLMVLSFIDDRILAIVNFVEKIFPSSKLILNKIDDLLHLIATLPGKFDDTVDKLPCFNQVLFLDWAVTHAICLLKFMTTILMNCGRDVTREKEILVDVNSNEGLNGSESADKSECCSEGITVSSVSEIQQTTYNIEVLKIGTKGVEDDEDCKENEKGSYRRALEEGTRDQAVEDKDKDKEDCISDENGTTKNAEKDENNERQTAKMEESVEKVEGVEEIPDQSYKVNISNVENSEVKDEHKEEEYVEKAEGNEEIQSKEENSEVKDENKERHTAKIEEEEEGNEEVSDESYKSILSEEEENSEEAAVMDNEYEDAVSNGSIESEDDILELFENAWLMKITRKKGDLLPRSASVV